MLKYLKIYQIIISSDHGKQQHNNKTLETSQKNMKSSYLSNILFIILIQYISCQSNLLCDSGFQRSVLTNQMSNDYQNIISKYEHTPNDYSCWYSPGKMSCQIKQFQVMGSITKVADFLTGTPNTICQNVNLVIQRTYQLKFNFIIDGCHTSCDLTFSLNNNSVYKVTSNDVVVPVNGVYRFSATKTSNSLCFIPTINFKSGASLTAKLYYGPVLDNVTLTEVIATPPSNSTQQSTNTTNNTTSNTTTSNNASNTNNTNNSTRNSTSNNTNADNTTTGQNQTTNKNITNHTQNSSQQINNSSGNFSLPYVQDLVINFKTLWNPYSGILYFYSDWKRNQLYPIQIFQLAIIEIDKEVQYNRKLLFDIDNFLYLQLVPNVVYTSLLINTVRIYLPTQLVQLSSTYSVRLIFTMNGQKIQADILSYSEEKILKSVEPYIEQVTANLKKSFVYLNMFYCSYFILGIIQFWNLTLLYNFLAISTVPQFAQAFFSKLMNFFFTFNSLSIEINKLLTKTAKTESLFDFSALSQHEKMLVSKNDRVWFSFVGLSSNFMGNNFDALVLLCFFATKYFLLRLILRCLKNKFEQLKSIRSHLFIKQLARQFLCFTPFIILSALSVFVYLGETTFLGKLNNSLHLLLVFLVISIPCVALTRILASSQRKKQKTKKQKNRLEKVIQILLNTLVPATVFINNSIGFFVLVSMLVLWKLANFFMNWSVYSRLEKLNKSVVNLCWLAYHCSFFALYLMDNIVLQNAGLRSSIIKYATLVSMFAILIGGLFDVLDCIIQMLKFIIKGIIFFCKICCKESKPNQEKQPAQRPQNKSKIKQISHQAKRKIRRTELHKNEPHYQWMNLNMTTQHVQTKQTARSEQKKRNNKIKADRSVKSNNKEISKQKINQFVIMIPCQTVDGIQNRISQIDHTVTKKAQIKKSRFFRSKETKF